MQKTEVYSWRLDPELKRALESAARAEGTNLSRLLDRIAAQWLQRERDTRDEDETLIRARARALRYVGSIHGSDPGRAANTAPRVRAILEQKRARRRAG
jgi:hypothetical protein